MSRRYGEPVEVRRRDDEPAEFLWRSRLYVVQDVLAQWVETGAWWRTGASGEREFWRVEASRGRVHGSGVFDLCFDWSPTTGSGWSLAQVLD